MKKVVLKLDLSDEKIKQKAMKNVSSLSGVDSIAMDMKDKKLTVTGDIDPVTVVSKLRKLCHTEIVSVGPAKEPEKKKDNGGDNKKKEDDKKKTTNDDQNKNNNKTSKDDVFKLPYHNPYPYYNYHHQQQQNVHHQPYYSYDHPPTPYYTKVVHDDTPNCVIS